MKNLFVALVLFVSMIAGAQAAYCDTRPTARDQQYCWKSAIDMYSSQNGNEYKKLSAKLSKAKQQQLQANQNNWWANVRAQCQTSECIANSLKARTGWLSSQGPKAFGLK